MTDNLPAEQRRRQNPPVQHKVQGSAGQTRRPAEQRTRNNAAGNHPAVQRGRTPVPARSGNSAPHSTSARKAVPRNAAHNTAPHSDPRSAGGQSQRRPAQPQQHARPQVPQNRRPVQQRPPVQNRPVQHKAPEKKPAVKKQTPKVKIPVRPFVLFGLIMVLVGAITVFVFFMVSESSLIKKTVTVEVGNPANFEMFLEGEPKYPQYLSTNLDFTTVDYTMPQSVFFVITLYGIDHNCELKVADTIAPKADPIPQEMMSVDQLPDAKDCVTNIVDATPVTVTWADKPDISAGGEFTASAKLTDVAGNETVVLVPLSVTRDSVPPVITGTRDITIIKGESISYRTGVEVTDNYDKNPRLDIDASGVKLNTEGEYTAVYRATDFTGNVSEVKINVKIKPKPKEYVEPEVVYAQAKEIVDKIITPEMTDMEKALQIVWWCRYNIHFNVRIKPKSWTEAAYNAFRERRGNCLSTASCVRAMLDVCGIENMFVTRWPYQVAKHYWNYVKIDGQWYHCDATWRQNYSSYFFMYTTKELLSFWHDGWNGFEFDQKKYPESATASVQKKIDYKNHKIKS